MMIITKRKNNVSVSIHLDIEELFVLYFLGILSVDASILAFRGKVINGAVCAPVDMAREDFVDFIKRISVAKRTRQQFFDSLPYTKKVFDGISDSIKRYRGNNVNE